MLSSKAKCQRSAQVHHTLYRGIMACSGSRGAKLCFCRRDEKMTQDM